MLISLLHPKPRRERALIGVVQFSCSEFHEHFVPTNFT